MQLPFFIHAKFNFFLADYFNQTKFFISHTQCLGLKILLIANTFKKVQITHFNFSRKALLMLTILSTELLIKSPYTTE
jgi:hypothetical protein